MNRTILPDPPDSYYTPFFNPAGEPAEPEVKADCGHWSFEEEVTSISGRTYCCNCYDVILGNTDPTGKD